MTKCKAQKTRKRRTYNLLQTSSKPNQDYADELHAVEEHLQPQKQQKTEKLALSPLLTLKNPQKHKKKSNKNA